MNNKPHSSVLSYLLSLSFTNIYRLLPKCDLSHTFLEGSCSYILVLADTWLYPEIPNKEVSKTTNSIMYASTIELKDVMAVSRLQLTRGLSPQLSNSALRIISVVYSLPSTQILFRACYQPPDSGPLFVKQLRESISGC